MRALFVNENIGGHATTHLHLRRALEGHPRVRATFLDVPAPGLGRRLAGAPVPGLARLDLDLQPLRSQLALSAWTRRRLGPLLADADVVHVFTHNAALLSAGALRTRPAVVALDSTDAMNAYCLPYREATRFTPWTVAATKLFERRVYDAADVLVTTSEPTRASLRVEYGVAPERIELLHYGITAPVFAAPAAEGVRAERPRLVFSARTLERKGGHQLLRVHQEHLRDRCDLVLVTPEAVPPAPGVTVVDDLDTGDPRLWEVLRSSSVFVFPSRIDQQPNAVMEAMAAGLPVVAHPINAMADMVEHGSNGLHPADPSDAALAAAVSRLVDDAALRLRMGEASRARFDARFSAHATVERLVGLFDEAVHRHAGEPTRREVPR